MNRRAFIGSLAIGILPAPHVVRAQSVHKVYRIGILSSRDRTSEMTGPQPQRAGPWWPVTVGAVMDVPRAVQ
jgi:hypothetical protein